MKKWIATIVGLYLAFVLGYSMLPTGFSALLSWLGPVFGASFHVLLSMIFISLGDPIAFTSLLAMWASVGLIVGLIIRKRIGGLLTALSVYPLTDIIMGLAGFRIFQIVQRLDINVSGAGGLPSLNFLPPPPPGTNLATIFNAPVIGDLSNVVSKLMSGGGGFDPSTVIAPIISTIGFNIVKILIILGIFGLIGGEIGGRIEKMIRAGRGIKIESGPAAPVKMTGILLAIILLGGMATAPVFISSVNATPDPFYYENISTYVLPDGTALFTSVFIDSELNLNNVRISGQTYSDSMAGILISMDIGSLPPILSNPTMLSQFLPLPSDAMQLVGMAQNYLNILPSTLFIIVYKGLDTSAARARADQAAADFSAGYGTGLSFFMGIPVGEGSQRLNVFIYQSETPLATEGNHIAQTIPIARDGLATVVKASWDSGRFVPGRTGRSSNGTLMAAGFIVPSAFFGLDGGNIPAIVRPLLMANTPVGVVGLGAYFLGAFHSSPQDHALNIADLLGYYGPIQFSPQATISAIAMFVPNATATGPAPFKAKIISTVSLDQIAALIPQVATLNQTGLPIEFSSVASGTALNNTILSLGFIYAFPIQLRVYKTVKPSTADQNSILTVIVTIVNNDTDAATNVLLNDTASLFFYKEAAKVVSGSLQHSWSSIPGKTSANYSYTISLSREGVYTLMPAVVSYTWSGNEYTAISPFAYASISSPNVLTITIVGFAAAWQYATEIINYIPGLQGYGSLILTIIIVAVIAIVALTEYWGYRKARKEAQKIVAPAPAI